MSNREKNFADLLVEKIFANLKVALPGTILKYDHKTQKAQIKLIGSEQLESGAIVDYPIVSNVPVFFFRSGGASLNFPVNPNDTCLVIFLDRDNTNFLLSKEHKKKEAS